MNCSSAVNFVKFGKAFGLGNLFRFYLKKWDSIDLPISMPIFGTVSRKEELFSIRDNFLQGSIREGELERRIAAAKEPVIVDCGINTGVTVRWWFYLNPKATVYGIDMMQEANNFTVKALTEDSRARYIPITAAIFSETGRDLKIHYDDPLFGGNSIEESDKYRENRRVLTKTLDDCLSGYRIGVIDLLKVDVENYSVPLFQGGAGALSKAKNILLEVHSQKEREDSVSLLVENGFRVRSSHRRHLWLEKAF